MATLIVIVILLIDQTIKLWVKTHMALHESIHVTDWFYIAFIENNGMAYGMQLGSKLILSLFRVVAISALAYYVWLQVRKNEAISLIVCSMGLCLSLPQIMMWRRWWHSETAMPPS